MLQSTAALGATWGAAQLADPVVAQTSPDLTKWAQSLPIPTVRQPDGTQDGYDYYQIPITEFTQSLHPDLPETTLWGFDGSYPGPIIEAQQDTPIRCFFDNSSLPTSHLFDVDTRVGGTQSEDYDDYSGSVPEVRTSTHVHGLSVAPEDDGQARAWTSPDGTQGPGFVTNDQHLPNHQARMTSTYHDHTLGITRLNAYAGMVGLYQITSQAEQNLGLPSGDYDIPLVIQDKSFNDDGSLYYPSDFQPEFGGDTAVVNGAVWPTLSVEPRRYRFRIVNGSNHRTFNLSVSNESGSGTPTVHQFAPDHGFLEEVVDIGFGGTLGSLLLTPFERAEIVVDFSEFAGETLTLTNDAEFPYLGDNSGSDLTDVLQITVQDTSVSDPSTQPSNLSLPAPINYDENSVSKRRKFSLDTETSGELLTHTLNGYGFGDEAGVVSPALDTNEIWEFTNETAHAHPIHLHLVDFRVIGRGAYGAGDPDPNELGGKDTVRVEPNETVRILTRFEDFTGRYPWHCHALEHEDQKMMQQFEVDSQQTVDILVCSLTDWFYHDSIPDGNQAIQNMSADFAAETGADTVTIDLITDDDGASAFPSTAAELNQYDVLVLNNTQGVIFDAEQQAAITEYVQAGGGVASIHNPADSHKDWDWYMDMIGAKFDGHPDPQTAEMRTEDRVHPSSAHLPARWDHFDELYDWVENPRGDVHVLLTVDQDSYSGTNMSREDHPMAWCHEFDGGRSWYTNLGHEPDTWNIDDFLEHVKQGILWAGGFIDGEASATTWDAYERTELTGDVSEPMSMTVAPDGRVFVINRDSDINVVDPDTGETSTALSKEFLSSTEEDGGHSVAVDPDFESNNWLYAYYSPVESEFEAGEDTPYNKLVRYTVNGDQIDPNSAVEILRVPTQRTNPNHYGGEIQFGPDGNLWLSTGDNTSPFDSSGYTPIDESTSEEGRDAQGTAADTSHLGGSLLRISPNADGSYDIPSGNIQDTSWASGYDDSTVRPEIYAMGVRNPFRYHVDDDTGWAYLADFGPDAGSWNVDRGPPGIVEYTQIREPSYLGWPYVVGPNHPYIDYDFGTGTSGSAFDPTNLVNDSPNNGGIQNLPTPIEAMMYVHGDWSTYTNEPSGGVWTTPDQAPFPELSDEAPIGGPLVRLPNTTAPGALPEYFDGKWLIGEWGSGVFHVVSLDDNGDLLTISPFLSDMEIHSPMDIEIGPEGRLHYVDFGPGYYVDNPKIYRIDHEPGTSHGDGGGGGTVGDLSAPFGMNSGGDTITAHGVQFVGGHGSSDAVTAINDPYTTSTEDAIANTDTDALYQAEDAGTDIGYEVAMEPGVYDVTVHFCETWHESSGSRVFDVLLNGDTVVSGLDIYSEAGHDAAHEITVSGVEAATGLTIETSTTTDNSQFSGVEVAHGNWDTFEEKISLAGELGGWVGMGPSSIQGQTNPTLDLQPGTTYSLEWTNADGAPHNFTIVDDSGSTVVSTSLVDTQGATQSVQFTATEAMAEYYCEPHSGTMRGDITTGDSGTGGGITDGTYRIDAVHSGKPIETADGTEGATVQQNTWSDADAQKWSITEQNDGTYLIENVNSGYVLDVEGASSDDGANVLVWSDNGGDNQRFDVYEDGSGYAIEAVHSGKVLEVNGSSTSDGANVQQQTDAGGDNQRFQFTEASTGGGITDGTYRIDAVHSGKPMEAAGSSEGATVQQNSWTGADTQQWSLTEQSDGTFTIENVASGYLVDVEGESTSDGANVLVWSSHGGDNQRFDVYEDGSGYAIEAVHSGSVLEVNGSSTSDGANVQQQTDAGGDNQRWTFESM